MDNGSSQLPIEEPLSHQERKELTSSTSSNEPARRTEPGWEPPAKEEILSLLEQTRLRTQEIERQSDAVIRGVKEKTRIAYHREIAKFPPGDIQAKPFVTEKIKNIAEHEFHLCLEGDQAVVTSVEMKLKKLAQIALENPSHPSSAEAVLLSNAFEKASETQDIHLQSDAVIRGVKGKTRQAYADGMNAFPGGDVRAANYAATKSADVAQKEFHRCLQGDPAVAVSVDIKLKNAAQAALANPSNPSSAEDVFLSRAFDQAKNHHMQQHPPATQGR